MQVQERSPQPTPAGDADRALRGGQLSCVWKRNPESGALECTWICVPEDAAWAADGSPAVSG